jgi:hypothetical protein
MRPEAAVEASPGVEPVRPSGNRFAGGPPHPGRARGHPAPKRRRCPRQESNLRPPPSEGGALPSELRGHGRPGRTRTRAAPSRSRALCPLSYRPPWSRGRGSNSRAPPYEGGALPAELPRGRRRRDSHPRGPAGQPLCRRLRSLLRHDVMAYSVRELNPRFLAENQVG